MKVSFVGRLPHGYPHFSSPRARRPGVRTCQSGLAESPRLRYREYWRPSLPGQINLESLEDTIALGRQLSQEFEQEIQIVADSTVRDYIERLGQRLAEGTRILRFPLTFKVVSSTEVDALSLPGGFIYINTGTILAAKNEAELASVIAHQVGHLAAGHGVELASKLEGVPR